MADIDTTDLKKTSLVSSLFGTNVRQYTMVIALVLLLIFFQWQTHGRMLTSSNFQNLVMGNAYVLILAMGMLMVIVIGQIDLSVGSVAGFVGMMVAISARDLGVSWWIAVLIGVLIGVAVGSWQGFWLAKMGIPGFISTLAGMMMFRGAVIWVSRSISVPAPKELRFLSSGYLPEWGPAFTQMNNSTLVLGIVGIAAVVFFQVRARAKQVKASGAAAPVWALIVRLALISGVIGYVTWIFGSGRPGTSFPVVGLIVLALILIYHTVTTRTPFGRNIYAVGGNKAAAALSGVNVARTYFFTMLNMSFLSSLAGILFIGRATAAGPDLGTGWELDAIAAVFIGGAAVSGGIGTIMGSMIGAMVMAVLNSGLMAMGVGADRTQVIKGLVLLAAVAFDVWNKQAGRPSIIGHLMKNFSKDPPAEQEGDPGNEIPGQSQVLPQDFDADSPSNDVEGIDEMIRTDSDKKEGNK
ncbi:MAG: sugar ABC transporter permease [Propionibacteriaceae bacterium]|nr:sugar ABC transporter permease [Propionibacteriaceae bacterium]